MPPNQLLSHLYDSQLINAPFVAIYLILSVSISERVGQVFVVMSTGARFLRAHETRNEVCKQIIWLLNRAIVIHFEM